MTHYDTLFLLDLSMITMILKTLLCKIKKLLESSCTCFKLHGCDKFPTRDSGNICKIQARSFQFESLPMYQCYKNKGIRFPWKYKAGLIY